MDYTTKVSEIMTRELTTVGPEDYLYNFKDKCSRRGFHHIPVEREGALVGIISTEDINRAISFFACQHKLQAKHIMTYKPIFLKPDMLIADAANMFVEHKVRALPIIEQDKLIGILSPYDIMQCLVEGYDTYLEMEMDEDYV